MIATRFGQFAEEKTARVIFNMLRENDKCRQKSAIILQRQNSSGAQLTEADIDMYIRNTVVPMCIRNGKAKEIIEEYIELKESISVSKSNPQTLSK